MSIPGIDQYGDLAQKYRAQMAEAKQQRTSCTGCAINRINEKFRRLLAERVRRDKLLNKQ